MSPIKSGEKKYKQETLPKLPNPLFSVLPTHQLYSKYAFYHFQQDAGSLQALLHCESVTLSRNIRGTGAISLPLSVNTQTSALQKRNLATVFIRLPWLSKRMLAIIVNFGNVSFFYTKQRLCRRNLSKLGMGIPLIPLRFRRNDHFCRGGSSHFQWQTNPTPNMVTGDEYPSFKPDHWVLYQQLIPGFRHESLSSI